MRLAQTTVAAVVPGLATISRPTRPAFWRSRISSGHTDRDGADRTAGELTSMVSSATWANRLNRWASAAENPEAAPSSARPSPNLGQPLHGGAGKHLPAPAG